MPREQALDTALDEQPAAIGSAWGDRLKIEQVAMTESRHMLHSALHGILSCTDSMHSRWRGGREAIYQELACSPAVATNTGPAPADSWGTVAEKLVIAAGDWAGEICPRMGSDR